MLISELPTGLKELARQRRNENMNQEDNDKDELSAAFTWGNTKEGYDFWHNIDQTNFEEWFDMQRELLKVTDDLIYSFGEWLIENCEIYDGVVGYNSEEYSLEGIIAVYKQELANDNIETTP